MDLVQDPFSGASPLPGDRPFTRREARAAGVSDPVLGDLVRAKVIRRLLRGVYAEARLPDTLDLRCRALRLVVPSDAFVSDLTAAWLHAGDDVLAPGQHLQVPAVSVFRPSDHGRVRNGIATSGERAIAPYDLMELGGLCVTTPLRTALDLGRLQRSRDMRLWGMDRMLATGSFEHADLLREVRRFARQRGVVLLRLLAPLVDAGSQSFGETALRLRWTDAGLPRPQTQIEVERDGGAPYFLDLGSPSLRFAAEYDGDAWHSTAAQREHDQVRRGWLRSRRSWVVEVFRRDDVFGPTQDAEHRIRASYEHLVSLAPRRFVI